MDDLYLLDTDLVIAYKQNKSHGWTAFVDDYISKNGSFYLLPRVVELAGQLPPGFVPLKLEEEGDGKSHRGIYYLINTIFKSLDIKGKYADQLRLDLENVLIAYYYAAAASVEQIPDEKIFKDKVFFATSNLPMLKLVFGSAEKCRKVERLVDNHGFEHLVEVRMIFLKNNTWSDYVSLFNYYIEPSFKQNLQK